MRETIDFLYGWVMRAKLSLFFVSWLGAAAALAAPVCVHPNVNDFLKESRAAIHSKGTYFSLPSARFLPLRAEGRSLQWMAASWGADGGAIFVLDCKAVRIAALPSGHVERLRPGPAIAGFGQTLEVTYDPGIATNDESRDVELVAFSGGSIAKLWGHEVSERAGAPSLRVDYIDAYEWRYSADGTMIRVAGRRKVGEFGDREHGWGPETSHILSRETFCWNPEQHSFISCGRE